MERTLTKTSSFQEKLSFGQIGESLIAQWLRKRRQYTLLPAYEKEIDNNKGPRLFGPDDQLISPDFLGLHGSDVKWFEAKHKSVFTWYRIGGCWVTGIDLRHYRDYCEVAQRFRYDVWLLFLHQHSRVDDPPDKEDLKHYPCPTGLFGINIAKPHDHDHLWEKQSAQYGKGGGMIYWNERQLTKFASLEQIIAISHMNNN